MKEAKFFCEYCDTEVPRNARFCPKCGHFFLSVRCPVCGLTGDQDDFNDGCPACGYAFSGTSVTQHSAQSADTARKHNRFTRRKSAGRFKGLFLNSGKYSNHRDDALPGWMYFAVTGILFVLILILISRL